MLKYADEIGADDAMDMYGGAGPRDLDDGSSNDDSKFEKNAVLASRLRQSNVEYYDSICRNGTARLDTVENRLAALKLLRKEQLLSLRSNDKQSKFLSDLNVDKLVTPYDLWDNIDKQWANIERHQEDAVFGKLEEIDYFSLRAMLQVGTESDTEKVISPRPCYVQVSQHFLTCCERYFSCSVDGMLSYPAKYGSPSSVCHATEKLGRSNLCRGVHRSCL